MVARSLPLCLRRPKESVRVRDANLVALSASCTDRVEFDNVRVDQSMLLGGPIENVMQSGVGGTNGRFADINLGDRIGASGGQLPGRRGLAA